MDAKKVVEATLIDTNSKQVYALDLTDSLVVGEWLIEGVACVRAGSTRCLFTPRHTYTTPHYSVVVVWKFSRGLR